MAEHNGMNSHNQTTEYRSWKGAKYRCHNPSDKDYPKWGGRGIKMCQEWRDSFTAFLAYMGPKPTKAHTLDRIENDKGYEPGNCRWATRREQQNNRRNTVLIGEHKKPATHVAEELGLHESTIRKRVALGLDPEAPFYMGRKKRRKQK